MRPARSAPHASRQFVGAQKRAELRAESDVEQDFAVLYRKAYSPAVGHALYFFDHESARDVVQDAALDLFAKWPTIPLERKTIGTFIGAVHVAIKRQRRLDKQNDSVELTEELEERLLDQGQLEPPEPTIVHEGMDAVNLVHHALAALPPRCRQALLLHRDTELSYAEIAAMLELSVNTVSNHITRARRLLREYFERSGLLLSGGSVRRLLPPGDAGTEGAEGAP